MTDPRPVGAPATTDATIDLDAYLRRIGIDPSEANQLDPTAATLARLSRAHAETIPFENLDPLRGCPVSLDLGTLQDKLVSRRRGGYCFEQNLLFGAAARELGFTVTPMLGRVGPRDAARRGRTHLILQVRDRDGDLWHADVGFGASPTSGTPVEPLPFGPSGEQLRAGWRYRIEAHGTELVLTTADSDGRWDDMYSFVPDPVPMIDVETANWWSCTYPGARFRRLLVVATSEGSRRTVLTDAGGELSLARYTPTEAVTEPLDPAAVPALLDEQFGLAGWIWSADGRPEPETA